MMTPNHTSAKSKLFILYYGQKVAYWPAYDEIFDVSILTLNEPENVCLRLRTTASLTDEEKSRISVLKIANDFLNDFATNKGSCFWGSAHIYSIFQYFISIAIALPFTVLEDGKPRTYSVDDQIENKWITVNKSCEV